MKALVIIDVQNDFCPGGALAVPDGDKVVPVLNKYIEVFSREKAPIFATRDWHPEDTTHFTSGGGKWPQHCVQGTRGAEFHPDLKLPEDAIIISKGMDPKKDSYSCFQGYNPISRNFLKRSGFNIVKGKDFLTLLRELKIEELYMGGLATDYCVKSSVLDALKNGFKVKLLIDAIRGVDLAPGDSEKAILEMVKAGAEKFNF